jgi:hypothetical protein
MKFLAALSVLGLARAALVEQWWNITYATANPDGVSSRVHHSNKTPFDGPRFENFLPACDANHCSSLNDRSLVSMEHGREYRSFCRRRVVPNVMALGGGPQVTVGQ